MGACGWVIIFCIGYVTLYVRMPEKYIYENLRYVDRYIYT